MTLSPVSIIAKYDCLRGTTEIVRFRSFGEHLASSNSEQGGEQHVAALCTGPENTIVVDLIERHGALQRGEDSGLVEYQVEADLVNTFRVMPSSLKPSSRLYP